VRDCACACALEEGDGWGRVECEGANLASKKQSHKNESMLAC